jgi:2-polyprenyl-3-methyl-5-hydroxy-6-metoxy-1,4-benzoquinol methylase
MMNDRVTIDAYDATARAFTDRWFDLRLETDMGRFVARLAPGVRVLDVGCGPGRDAAWLGEQGFEAICSLGDPGRVA